MPSSKSASKPAAMVTANKPTQKQEGESEIASSGEQAATTNGKKKIVFFGLSGVAGISLAILGGLYAEGIISFSQKFGSQNAPEIYHELKDGITTKINSAKNQDEHYVKYNIAYMTHQDEVDKSLSNNEPLVVNNLLEITARHSYEELLTLAGKETLQKEALIDANQIVKKDNPGNSVTEALLTDFVMQ